MASLLISHFVVRCQCQSGGLTLLLDDRTALAWKNATTSFPEACALGLLTRNPEKKAGCRKNVTVVVAFEFV